METKTVLPPFAIAALYTNTLMGGDVDKAAHLPANTDAGETVLLKNKQWYLGENKKAIAIIVNDETATFINDEWLATLGKLLEALQMNLNDVAIINYHHTPVSFAMLQKQLSVQYILLFDVSTAQLEFPFTIPYYQIQRYAGYTILSASSITLSENKTDEQIRAEKRKIMAKPENNFYSLAMPSIIFATNNGHKVNEIKSIAGKEINIITLKEAGIDIDIPEPFDTLTANASAKSQTIYSLTQQNCFSEDTGLEVEALNGAPGVKSARYAGEHKNFQANIDKLLQALEGKDNRRARFRTIISLIWNKEEFF